MSGEEHMISEVGRQMTPTRKGQGSGAALVQSRKKAWPFFGIQSMVLTAANHMGLGAT